MGSHRPALVLYTNHRNSNYPQTELVNNQAAQHISHKKGKKKKSIQANRAALSVINHQDYACLILYPLPSFIRKGESHPPIGRLNPFPDKPTTYYSCLFLLYREANSKSFIRILVEKSGSSGPSQSGCDGGGHGARCDASCGARRAPRRRRCRRGSRRQRP